MATITIISVGTLKEKYLTDAISEYKKRITQYAKVEELSIKEARILNEDDSSEIQRALDEEADKIISQIPKDSYKIALCVEGKEYDSTSLSKIVRDAVDTSGKITFIIGSSHGLSERVKKECDLRLSFSKMTFPHQLMRVILFEAVYRSFTIIHGKRYHK
jgi:23S rRNA (pseudouridine1915-N3)-methyltransferase